MSDLDAREQLSLELVNRARMDPLGEAVRYGIDLNAGLAAQAHANYLLSSGAFSHTGSGSSTSNGRMASAGYAAAGTFFSGENIAWTGSTGAYNANAEVLSQHQSWFLSAGHRENIMNVNYEELGVGHAAFTGVAYRGATNGMIMVQNYAALTTPDKLITGVSYNDTDANDFYSIGEGQGARQVQLFQSGSLVNSATTTAAGGYGIKTTATGQLEIVFSGGGVSGSHGVLVNLSASNIKVDMVDNNTIETNFSATLSQSAQNLRLIGIENVNGTGNGLNNTLWGNKGNNVFNGGNGNDAVVGGAGTDTVVFSGNLNQYVVTYTAATLTHTFYGNDGFIDTVTGVENFQFADGTRTAAQLTISGAAPVRTAGITAVTAAANEGNSGTNAFTFNVSLNAAAYSTLTVNWSAAGTGASAASTADFSGAMSGTLTFAAGESVKTITLNVVGDTTAEANETFAVSLSTPSTGLSIATASATATITNDDASGPNIINGDAGDNTLIGTTGIDQINGLGGADTISGGAGSDTLNGGAGNDRIIYDAADLASNVNGGADTDTLVVIGGTLPTGFNLAASAFEQAEWQQTDTAGQSWTTIVSRYNSSWQMTSSSTILDNGMDREMVYDYSQAIVWQSRQLDYNAPAAGGLLAYDYFVFDDLSSRETGHDYTAGVVWQSLRNDYNSAGFKTYDYYVFDNGMSRETGYDNSSGIVWQSLRNDYDVTGFKTYDYFVFDNGASRDTAYDNTSGVIWQSLRNDYDAKGFKTYDYRVFDNGSSRETGYDNTAGVVWQSLRNDYNASGFKTYEYYVFDNGTSRETGYDNTAGVVWQSLRQDYTAGGTMSYQYYVFDDNTSRQVVIDAANQFSWNTQVTNYNASGQVVDFFET
jgi:hypothetical protein